MRTVWSNDPVKTRLPSVVNATDATAIALIDQQAPLLTEEVTAISDYLAAGGSMFLVRDVVGGDAEAAGRDPSTFRHSLNVWCAFDEDRSSARHLLEEAMGSLYQLPFDRFERWSPFGPPDEVAAKVKEGQKVALKDEDGTLLGRWLVERPDA